MEEPLKGIYVLIIRVDETIRTRVGALGNLTFNAGLYAYVGSSQNNLTCRVRRHQSKEKRLFWHIDYLLNNQASKVIGVYYSQKSKAEECRISRLLEKNAEPTVGFGCSDCRCRSHLFHAEDFGFLQEYMQSLKTPELH